MSDIQDWWFQQPAIARTFAAAMLATSVAVHFELLPFAWFYYSLDRLIRLPPEIWRPVTSFFVSGIQLGIILDPFFLFQYLSQLENGNPRFPRKEDLLWYLIFVGTTIIGFNHLLGGAAGFFTQGIILAIAYTATQDLRGQSAGFFFFTVPAQTIPYCMMLSTLIQSHGSLMALKLQFTGLLAAHLYDFLTRIYPEFGGGPNVLPTPSFLSRLVTTPRILQRDYGTAIRSAPAGQTSGSSTGASTGSGSVLPDSWRTRGTGHRLGGE